MADSQPQAQPGNWVDPFRNYNFRVEIQGVEQGRFTECVGLGARVRTIQYREGGMNQIVHNIPGRVEYAEVTLRYGLTTSTDLWQWFLGTLQGNVERRNVTISTLSSDGALVAAGWNLLSCWPSSWRGAPLDAMGDQIAIECVTLVYEGLERS